MTGLSAVGALVVIIALFVLFKEAAIHIILGLLMLGALVSVAAFVFG